MDEKKQELAPLPSLQEVMQLGKVFADSGYFSDARGASQAIVKILAGRELGFPPLVAMTNIHIIEGKPSVGAHLMACLIKRSGKYAYKVLQRTRDVCELEFLEGGQLLGRIRVTLKEFADSGVATGKDGKLKANWQRSSDDMLFARAISKGYKTYCPDLTAGMVVYAEGEIEPEQPEPIPFKQPELGDPIDADFEVKPEPPPVDHDNHPDAEQVQRILQLSTDLNLLQDKFKERLLSKFGTSDLGLLSKGQADEIEFALADTLKVRQFAQRLREPTP